MCYIIVLLDEDIAFGCFQQKIFEIDACSEIYLVKLIFYSVDDTLQGFKIYSTKVRNNIIGAFPTKIILFLLVLFFSKTILVFNI